MSAATHAASRNVPWVLLRISNQLFGVPATHVREMAELGAVTRIPQSPPHVLGLITLRGQIVPAIDLRRRLGMLPAAEETATFLRELAEHEAAHVALYKRLSAAGEGGGGIADGHGGGCPTTDWLESQKEQWLGRAAQIVKLEPAHYNLHATIDGMMESRAGAAGISAVRDRELAELQRASAGVRERVSKAHPQISVVLDWRERLLAVTVDEVESIERLKGDCLEELPVTSSDLSSELTRQAGKRTRDDALVLILELARLFEGSSADPRPAELAPVEVAALPAG